MAGRSRSETAPNRFEAHSRWYRPGLHHLWCFESFQASRCPVLGSSAGCGARPTRPELQVLGQVLKLEPTTFSRAGLRTEDCGSCDGAVHPPLGCSPDPIAVRPRFGNV